MLFFNVNGKKAANVACLSMKDYFQVGDRVKVQDDASSSSEKIYHKVVTVTGVTEHLVTVQYDLWKRSYNVGDLITKRLQSY